MFATRHEPVIFFCAGKFDYIRILEENFRWSTKETQGWLIVGWKRPKWKYSVTS